MNRHDSAPKSDFGDGRKPSPRGPQVAGGLYVHWPFCETKCGYCDFYSVPRAGGDVGPLLRATLSELRSRIEACSHPIETVFLGGGTPTTLDADDLRTLLAGLRDATTGQPVCEWTIEANPATVDEKKGEVLMAQGVTRVSLGAQSFHAAELAALERIHEVEDIPAAVRTIRAAGICDLNLDLIFGISGQTMASWQESLKIALDLEPDHLACYGLTYEPGTRLTRQLDRGQVTPCDEGIEAEMFLATIDILAAAGFEQYEISNFARCGHRCRHNLNYWRNGPYIGVGPSAAGCDGGRRYKNISDIAGYVRRLVGGDSPEVETEELDATARGIEGLMMQLRLVDGFCPAEFASQTGVDLLAVAGDTLERLATADLLSVSAERVHLTRRGLLYADGVIVELAAAIDARSGLSLPVVKCPK